MTLDRRRPWLGDVADLRGHEDELLEDPELCTRLFTGKHEAYSVGLALGRHPSQQRDVPVVTPTAPADVFLAVPNDTIHRLIAELGYVDITDDEFEELKRMSSDDPGVAWNLFRAGRCAAELLSYIRPPSDEEIQGMFELAFGNDCAVIPDSDVPPEGQ